MIRCRGAGVLLTIVALAAGCAGEPGVTGGLDLEYERRAPGGSVALWTVDRDGLIGYAGGQDALDGDPTWSRPLTAEELAQYLDLVAALDRFRATHADGADADIRTEVRVRDGAASRRLRAVGDPPQFADLLQFLQATSAERLDRYLDRLPRPGPVAP